MAAKRRQNIITVLTTLPQGWVLSRMHQCLIVITTMWTESSWAFPESYLLMTVGSRARAMSINGKTKTIRTPPLRWVSAQLLYVWVSAQWRSQWCSQNLRRPFLRAVRFDNLINYIKLRWTTFPLPHYAAQFFPYRECNMCDRVDLVNCG